MHCMREVYKNKYSIVIVAHIRLKWLMRFCSSLKGRRSPKMRRIYVGEAKENTRGC